MNAAVQAAPTRRYIRAIQSSALFILGICLGYWAAITAHDLIGLLEPGLRGATMATGTAVAAAFVKAWQDAAEIHKNLLKYVRQGGEPLNTVRTLVSTATVVFGFTLGVLGFIDLVKRGSSVEPVATSLPNFVHVLHSEEPDSPVILVTPALIFSSAGLNQPGIATFSDLNLISPELFSAFSVNFSKAQHEAAERLVSKLQSECGTQQGNAPLELTVYGFANDLPIRDEKGAERLDSPLLNEAVANFRGKVFAYSLTAAAEKLSHDDHINMVFRWRPWRDLDEMKQIRDEVAFRNIEISYSWQIDHRSAVVMAQDPKKCRLLDAKPTQPKSD